MDIIQHADFIDRWVSFNHSLHMCLPTKGVYGGHARACPMFIVGMLLLANRANAIDFHDLVWSQQSLNT